MSAETGFVSRGFHYSQVGLWVGDELRWLAHTLSVFSRRITSRILCVSLCCSNRALPVPRSFHSFVAESNRKSLERLRTRGTRRSRGRISHRKSIQKRIGEEGHLPLEDYGLIFFISLCYDLFCELGDRFEVGIMSILRLRQVIKVKCMTDGWCGLGCGRASEGSPPSQNEKKKNADLELGC